VLQEVAYAVVLAMVYLLFSLGMTMTWSSLGILNFAHGTIFMFSALVGYVLVKDQRLSLAVMLAIGILVGTALSLITHLLIFGRILAKARDSRSVELEILVGGIGAGYILLGIADHITQMPFGFSGSSFVVKSYNFATIRITNAQVATVVGGLLLSAAVIYWLQRSKSGLAVRAIGIDAETASSLGINRQRLGAITMAVSGSLAGVAGVLLTYDVGALDPNAGDSFLLKGFAVIVLGGIGSISGAALGALVLAGSETLVLNYTSGAWVDAVSFGVVVLILLVKPSGILGRRTIIRT
jgi:branched-chain amino acid transport system permease protein